MLRDKEITPEVSYEYYRDMTQKELAELIHANPQQLNRAIKGDMTPKSRELREQVARVLNL